MQENENTGNTRKGLIDYWREMPHRTLTTCVIVAIVTTAVGIGCGYTIGVNDQAVKLAKSEMVRYDDGYKDARSKYESMQRMLTDARDTIQQSKSLSKDVKDLQSQKDDLQSQVDTLNGQLNSLKGQVDEARKTTVGDGVWQVGRDIDAGTYRPNNAVGEDCYWEVSTGNGLNDIIQNGIPGGGYPQVSVSDGQQLKLQSCGVWSKQ